jgi:ferrous iron transport protein B
LQPLLAAEWTLPTALSLLVWFVFAPQCAPTLAVVRRETGSWKWAAVMAGYMTALAYAAAFVTFHLSSRLLG